MSWETILKNLSPATLLARNTQLNDSKATGRNEVIRIMKNNSDRLGDDFPTLNHLKEDLKNYYQKLYLIDTEAWFNQATWMQNTLNNAGYTYDDVNWEEALIPVLAVYDEIIDSIEYGDLL
jgi:hypothetical protein